MIGEAWFTCAPPISAVSRGFITRLPPTSDWPIATDFMRAPSLAVELLFAASSSTNHIISLQHYSLSGFDDLISLSLSLSLSCRCLLALVCYLVVLLSSEWFLPVILLNIEISIESSLCVSFSVCVCASSPALFRSLELTTTTLPSFFISSSLPLPIFVLGRPKNYRYCLPTMSTGGGISPFDLVSLGAQTPAGLYRSLEGVELGGGPWKSSFASVCGC